MDSTDEVKVSLKRAIQELKRKAAHRGDWIPPPPKGDGRLLGPGPGVMLDGGKKNVALSKFWQEAREDTVKDRSLEEARSDFEAMGFLKPQREEKRPPASLNRGHDRQHHTSEDPRPTSLGRGHDRQRRPPEEPRPTSLGRGHDRHRSSEEPRPTSLGRGHDPQRRPSVPNQIDMSSCETEGVREASWIEEIFGLQEEETFSNASDESFHTMNSKHEFKEEEDDDEMEEVLGPGDCLEDLIKRIPAGGGQKVSVRQARTWLDQAGSKNLDDEKKVRKCV